MPCHVRLVLERQVMHKLNRLQARQGSCYMIVYMMVSHALHAGEGRDSGAQLVRVPVPQPGVPASEAPRRRLDLTAATGAELACCTASNVLYYSVKYV